MEKCIKKVVIDHEEGTATFYIGYLLLEKVCVNVLDLLELYPKGFVVEKGHDFMQTEFQLTEAPSCIVFTFNAKGQFVSGKYNVKCGNAPITLLIPEPIVMILPLDVPFPSAKILSIDFLGLRLNNKSNGQSLHKNMNSNTDLK